MTPTEYAAWTDSILRYVGRLLTHDAGTPEWTIGRTFALMGHDGIRLAYVEQLVAENREQSRVHEIAWDLRALLLRWSAVEPGDVLAPIALAVTGSEG